MSAQKSDTENDAGVVIVSSNTAVNVSIASKLVNELLAHKGKAHEVFHIVISKRYYDRKTRNLERQALAEEEYLQE